MGQAFMHVVFGHRVEGPALYHCMEKLGVKPSYPIDKIPKYFSEWDKAGMEKMRKIFLPNYGTGKKSWEPGPGFRCFYHGGDGYSWHIGIELKQHRMNEGFKNISFEEIQKILFESRNDVKLYEQFQKEFDKIPDILKDCFPPEPSIHLIWGYD